MTNRACHARLVEVLCVALVLAAAGAAMIASLAGKSATIDEPEQLWAGVLHLTRRDYSVNPHPPLSKLLQAAPLYCLGARVPPGHRPWPGVVSDMRGGRNFLYWSGLSHRRLLLAGRLVNVAICLLFLLAVYLLARRLYGVAGAALALGLLVADPNLAAHARLATTDLSATVFPVLGLAALGWALEAPGRRRLLLAGGALGLGLGAKVSTIYLLAAIPLACLVAGEGTLRQRAGRAGLLIVAALLVLAALYQGVGLLQYPRGLRLVLDDRWSRPFYLLGQVRHDGWWRYVPVVLAVKLPHAQQLLALALLASLIRRPARTAERPLLVGAVLVAAGVLLAPINFGVRHVLPVLAIGSLLAGRMVAGRPRLAAASLLGLAALSGPGLVRCWPHYLAYYNELAGGPAAGHRLVIDTNLDLGQDLDALARWARARRIPGLYLCYFGSADPRAIALRYRYVPDDRNAHLAPGVDLPPDLAPRYLAISVTYLYLYREGGFDWLARRRPAAVIGHTIRVYDIAGDREAALRLASIYAGAGMERQADEERRRALTLRGR